MLPAAATGPGREIMAISVGTVKCGPVQAGLREAEKK
jgi:hypothetical protein